MPESEGSDCVTDQTGQDLKTGRRARLSCQPVWPSGNALDWQADDVGSISPASAIGSFLFRQRLWFFDTVL